MMSVPQRYFLIQIPGWVLAAIILYSFHRLFALPLWLAAILMVADIVKDIVLYPYLRRAYETTESMPAEWLIGERAVIRQALTPEGYVQVRGELWRARTVDPPPSLGVATRKYSSTEEKIRAEAEMDVQQASVRMGITYWIRWWYLPVWVTA